MSNFIVDPNLLACPDPDAVAPEEFEEIFTTYLESLADFSLMRDNCASVVFWADEGLPLLLHEHDSYPFRHKLVKAFSVLPEDAEFQIEDANSLAISLLERSMRFEEHCDIRELVVSDCEIEGDPVVCRSEAFRDHLCQMLHKAVLVLGDGGKFSPNTFLASGSRPSKAQKALVKYIVEMLERDDGEIVSIPEAMCFDLQMYSSVHALTSQIDTAVWWGQGSAAALIDLCLLLAYGNDIDPWKSIEDHKDSIVLGANFLASAEKHGFLHESGKIQRLLKVCLNLLADRNLAATHALRSGRGGDDPQRTRGNWKAWRYDIDYEYHLHYWKCGTRLELADVVVHNDFSIT